ncbi:MAG TPA: phenylalanine 4-monooxygenase [Asticcacaulis sp.]
MRSEEDRRGGVGGHAPERPDWITPQDWDGYTPQEHGVWRTLFERQIGLLPGRASQHYLDGLNGLPIGPEAIPDFEALSEVLTRRTGWRVVAVPGMVPNDVFFDHLAHRRFPAGRFIRTPAQLDYLQEPDVFHDIFGHAPMLMNPVMADFMQAYGEGGLRALKLGALERIARLYWYTVEFGLIAEAGDARILGAGIASSFTETLYALESPSPRRIGFDLRRVMRTHYRIDALQENYFVLPSLDVLFDLADTDFGPVYEELAGMPDIQPPAILPEDRVFMRGVGLER